MRCHSWIRQTLSDVRGTDEFGKLVWRSGAHGDWVACDDYRNKIGKSLANDELRIEVDEEGVTADEEGTRFMML